MKINLQNIGIVQNSTLMLNGLTVITGKNNSGKTTVGKVLYALFDAVCSLRQKAENDRINYIFKQLDNVENTLEVFFYTRVLEPEHRDYLFSGYPALKTLFSQNIKIDLRKNEIERFAHDVERELQKFDSAVFDVSEANEELRRYQRFLQGRSREELPFSSMFETQRKNALSILKYLFSNLEKDLELKDYARESINQTLRVEFANQIQPVAAPEMPSKIELSSDESVLFDIEISNNNLVDRGDPVFFSSPIKRVYMIDDPFILDTPLRARVIRWEKTEPETILNTGHILHHNVKLTQEIRSARGLNIFEKTVLDESLKRIKSQIDEILPGTFDFSSEGEYYVQNGAKLKISNMATGSKMFSIIKILLEKGKLDSTTMLILDEPEAHLHPQWQNAFAEIIALLVKELGVKIVLTTHSSNFMLALDAYMRKYNLADVTNFYQTIASDEAGFVNYDCVNDDMGKIYQDFLQYFSEVKALRNRYLDSEA